MRKLTLLAPAAALLLSACLASKGDIRLLQDDLSSTRAQQAQRADAQERARARDDSLARVQLDSALHALAGLHDSLSNLSARFLNFQASATEQVRQLGAQMTTLENRVGISQRRIDEIAARTETAPAPAAPAPTSGSASAAPDSTPAIPGPAQLYISGRDQMSQGAFATARMAFGQLLTTYPTYPDAPHVAVLIGQCFEAEQNAAAADSAYQSVVAQYPKSPDAATALYKYGNSQLQQGHADAARTAWQRVLKDYPTSDAAGLVPDRLKALPGGN